MDAVASALKPLEKNELKAELLSSNTSKLFDFIEDIWLIHFHAL